MSLGFRLAIVFAIVTASTAVLVGAASFVTTDRQVVNEVDQFLRERADEIGDGRRSQPRNRRDDRDDAGSATNADAEVQILNDEGDIVSTSGIALPVDDIDRELADDNGRAVLRTIEVGGVDYRLITDHLSGGGAVQVARNLEESKGLVTNVQTRILYIAGLLAALSAVVGWIIAQRTTRPLRLLTDAVDEVAETRNFTVPVPVSGRDEVGRLARGFNRMLTALNQSQEQQKRLVQDAAHELRTPLTSITANVEWMMRAPDLDTPSQQEVLGSVRRELGELNELMSEIIELATESHEPPELVETDLVAVTTASVESFEQRTGRTVQLDWTPCVVLGDAESLSRAIANLLNNAHKYSPVESGIGVRVRHGAVMVDDAGTGIPVADRDRVFDRFFRRDDDRSKPGSGLGLSIVASIVDQHGGQVVVDDSALGGARVGFRLPVVSQ